MTKRRRRNRKSFGKNGYRNPFNRRVRNQILFNLSPASQYVTRFQGRLVASASAQTLGQLSDLYNYTDIADPTVGMQTAFVSWISTNKGSTFQISHWSQWFMFHNQCNTHVKLTLYEAVARYDIPAVTKMSVTDLISDSLTDSKSGGSIGTLAINTFGVTPYMCNRFTTAFKIVRRTTLEMVAGGQATYTFKSPRRKTINLNRYRNTSGTALINGEKGFYRVLVYQIHGFPCNDVTTKTDIAISEAAVDYVMREKVLVRYNQFQNYPTYGYMNAGTLGAATPTIMSEASGTAQTVVTA